MLNKNKLKKSSISSFILFFLITTLSIWPSYSSENIASSNSKIPTRIVSLSPSATEDLFAIGAGKQVIAVDDYSYYPKSTPITKLSGYAPNLEAIIAYKPDLVVIQSTGQSAKEIIANLTKLKIAVYEEITPKTLNEVYAEITTLGEITGNISGAKNVIKNMQSRIKKSLASVKTTKPVTFYHELDNTNYTITSKTFIGGVYKEFGLTNIADEAIGADKSGYPQLQSEFIVKANPQIIFLADGAKPQGTESYSTLKARPGWANISAIKSNSIRILPQDIPSRWGPRLTDFYALIAKAVNTFQIKVAKTN